MEIPESIQLFLQQPYTLSPEQIAFYEENRYIKLKQVLNEETLAFFREAITKQVNKMNTIATPVAERSTYGKAFLQLFNLWREDALIKELIFSKRLAKIATDLMQTTGVRMYHDQALFKEGGGGITPWHADQYYWLENPRKLTPICQNKLTPLRHFKLTP